MASLIIPARFRPGLARILALSDEESQSLLVALESLTQARAKVDFSSLPLIEGLTPDDMRQVLSALSSLYSVRALSESSPAEFAADICESIAHNRYDNLRFQKEDDYDRFRERLIRFLDINALNSRSKALYIQHEHERLFMKARIFTDIRPVFGEDPNTPPVAAVLTHTLKISCQTDSSVEDLFIALDTQDIATLREVLDRADAKAQSLKVVIDLSGVPLLDGSPSEDE